MRSLILAGFFALIVFFSLSPVSRASEQAHSYVVQPGDTLWKLAERFGTTPAAIVELNELADPNLLYVGQKLLIPTSDTPSPAPDPGGSNTPHEEESWLANPFAITRYCLDGYMSNGQWVHEGAVAADSSVFPLGTRLEIEGLGTYTVKDRFAWDAGARRLDVWTPSCATAIQWGVRYRKVRLIDENEKPATIPNYAQFEARALNFISQRRGDIVPFFSANGWSPSNINGIIRAWLVLTDEPSVIEAGRNPVAVARLYGFTEADAHALDYIGSRRPDVVSYYKKNGWASKTLRLIVADWLKITDETAIRTAGRNPLKVALLLGWAE